MSKTITLSRFELTNQNILSNIKDQHGKYLLSSLQIDNLLSMKQEDGTLLFNSSDDTKDMIYNIISQIRVYGFNDIYTRLQKQTRDEYLFNTPGFDSAKDIEINSIFSFKSKVEVVTGVFKCPKCHTDRVTYYQKQMRSADEPMTIIITCESCKYVWRE